MGSCCAIPIPEPKILKCAPDSTEPTHLVVNKLIVGDSASRQSKNLSLDRSSVDDPDVEIIEMQLDNTNRSGEEIYRKGPGFKMSKFDKRLPSTTTDFLAFSSIRDVQDHEIFTSQTPIKQARIRLDNGSVYEGEWLKGNMHGFGKLIWPNGSVYEVD